MKIFLDDIRLGPQDWVTVHTVEETIKCLKTGKVSRLSLDHDLGIDEEGRERTGYEVLCWIEWQVIEHGFVPPILSIHSANPVGHKRMSQVIEKITKHIGGNQ